LEEEAEAKRLQQKQLQAMTEADYGLDDDSWEEQDGEGDTPGPSAATVILEMLPDAQISEDTTAKERLDLLTGRYPEFMPLTKEFLDLQQQHRRLQSAVVEDLESANERDLKNDQREKFPATVSAIQYQALSAYLGMLVLYFGILSATAIKDGSNIATAPTQLRDHPVMEALVKAKQSWMVAKTLKHRPVTPKLPEKSRELASQIGQAAMGHKATNGVKPTQMQKQKRSRREAAIEAAELASRARRAERLQVVESDLASLATLSRNTGRDAASRQLAASSRHTGTANDAGKAGSNLGFGEETDLTPAEAAEKAKRRRTMRFYTSQIAQTEKKRGAARDAAGGDMDIPLHKSLRDRRAQWEADADRRKNRLESRGQGADADLGGESDEDDRRVAKQVRDEVPDDNDDMYYEGVTAKAKKAKAEKKSERKEEYNARVDAANAAYEVEEIGPDGKRRLNRLIEKNKGKSDRVHCTGGLELTIFSKVSPHSGRRRFATAGSRKEESTKRSVRSCQAFGLCSRAVRAKAGTRVSTDQLTISCCC
jgi:U3 small nucleolar RNA-associated protein 3